MAYPYPNSIADAAKTLDMDHRKWWQKINTASLNMGNSDHCVLGQLFDGYDNGMEVMFGVDAGNNMVSYDTIFGTNADKKDWVKEIKKRREGAAPATTPKKKVIDLTANERTQLVALILDQPAKLTDKQRLDLVVKLGNF